MTNRKSINICYAFQREMFSAEDLLATVLVYLLLAAVLVLFIVLRRKKVDIDTRKVLHILTGNFVFIWWMYESQLPMLVFFAFPFMALLLLSSPVSKLDFMHRNVIGQVSAEGHSLGLFFYACTIAVMVLVFFENFVAASIGIIAMTYGDGFSSLVGKRHGKRPIYKGKTLEGSLAAFAATTIMTYVVLLFYDMLIAGGHYTISTIPDVSFPLVALAAGIFVAVVELISPGEYDNLITPLATAAFLVLLGF